MRELHCPSHLVYPDNPTDFHIGIVGGGTAGWMAAATLRRRLGCRVSLVESDRIAGVGVGEATIPAMIDWIENMGIDEDEFLRRCGGTYKLAIRFDNWVEAKHRYWHPFGLCGLRIDGVDLVHFWKRGVRHGWLDASSHYTDFSLQKQLCDAGRSPRPLNAPSICANYAFHVDASRFAVFLRELAVSEGVAHRIGDVTGVQLNEYGEIASVKIDQQPALDADLYLDCTGFAGLLIEKGLRVPWIDWSDQLLCDRAVAVRLPTAPSSNQGSRESEQNVAPYTISTGLDAGWAWQIPLRDVTGAGYVYSSRHADSESARAELLRHVAQADADISTRELTMRVGRRQQCWQGNCVSLGLSSGFVEPLESTGIFLIQRALDELVDAFPNPVQATFNVHQFNNHMQQAYEEIRDFVLLHYVVSKRDDTSFWRDARAIQVPESLEASMQAYRERGAVELDPLTAVFAEANHHFIMLGAGIEPGRSPNHDDVLRRFDDAQLRELFTQLTHQNADFTRTLPSHLQTIQSVHHAQPDSAIVQRFSIPPKNVVATHPSRDAHIPFSTVSCLVRA
jgi:tryptophan 7-halogenase